MTWLVVYRHLLYALLGTIGVVLDSDHPAG